MRSERATGGGTGLFRFLFGGGWWVPWHLLMFLWAGVFWLTGSWLFDFVPGGGPQGGEAMLAFLLLGVMGMTCLSTVNALVYGAALSGSWLRRFVGTPAIAAGACVLALSPAVVLAGSGVAQAETRAGKWIAVVVYVALLAGWYALNLVALARARRMRLRS